MTEQSWDYPGSRWWKFDFHTHTPESRDTPWHRDGLQLEPRDWLLKYMAAGIDCVVVTDHNSGAWVDRLKATYEGMKAQAEAGQPPEGFRPLTLFPGVEISANGGVHVLAVFDPAATTGDIDRLLGAVDYRGTPGDSDGETGKSVAEVIAEILKAGAIAIPAHADADKGLLRVKPNTRQCALSTHMVRQALEVEGLLAVEWCNPNTPYPQAVENLAKPLARVLGSDCHSFQGQAVPGSRFTWVKMAQPTLEGLRLALLDGNGVSIRRSDEGTFDPFHVPEHCIGAIEIERGHVIGNGRSARVELSPYFNAVVGGRGTGKSTLVHALRLAARRGSELKSLPDDSEPRERFEAFCQVRKGRDDKGALRPETAIRVEWQHEGVRLRLNWRADAQGSAVEEWHNGQWQPSASQSIPAGRFPLRILSQGQIAEMAGGGRQALLAIIDEAAGVAELWETFEEARRTFFAQRARLREIDGKLAALPEVKRQLTEIEAKLKTLAKGDHAAIQQAYARAQQQRRAVEETLAQLREGIDVLRQAGARLLLDDWPPQHFDAAADGDMLAWRQAADASLAQARQQLEQAAATLQVGIVQLEADERLTAWRGRAEAAALAHQRLQAELAAQGMADPQAFARLTQEQQRLELQAKELQQLQTARTELQQQITAQQRFILERRRAITHRRQAFLQEKLARNEYVRMEVVPYGFDPFVIERSLRELIEVTDERFADDILKVENGQAQSGLAYDLAAAADQAKLERLAEVRNKLIEQTGKLGGHFRNYLEKKAQKPEFSDHVLTWFPEDDLMIEYQRDGQWFGISQGSQGQRSAALLAFLLAFGEEPIVLDQPEDDLDNHLIYDLIVRQIRENKLRRQLIVVTHNPNVVVNGDAELVHVMNFGQGQCYVACSGALQDKEVRDEVCRVMEGGREAFARRWKRLGREV